MAEIEFSGLSNTVDIFTDATLWQGGYTDGRGSLTNFPVPFEFQGSAYESEFYTAQRAIMENAKRDMRVNIHCDHQGVCSLLERGVIAKPWKYPHVDNLYRKLVSYVEDNNIEISVSWIASESNPADFLSRCELLSPDHATTEDTAPMCTSITGVHSPSHVVAAAEAESPSIAAVVTESPSIAAVDADSSSIAAVEAVSPLTAAAEAEPFSIAAINTESPSIAAVDAESPSIAVVEAESPSIAHAEAESPSIAPAAAEPPSIAAANTKSPLISAMNAESPSITHVEAELLYVTPVETDSEKSSHEKWSKSLDDAWSLLDTLPEADLEICRYKKPNVPCPRCAEHMKSMAIIDPISESQWDFVDVGAQHHIKPLLKAIAIKLNNNDAPGAYEEIKTFVAEQQLATIFS